MNVNGESASVYGPRGSRTFSFAEIRRVWGVRIGKITYDEDFIIIELEDGQKIDVGELDDGFGNLIDSMVQRLPNFLRDCITELDQSDGTDKLLWPNVGKA